MTSRRTGAAGGWSGLAVAMLALTGCGDGGAPGGSALGASTEARPAYGGTAVIAAPNDLDFANPLVTGDEFTLDVLRHALFVPLIRYTSEIDLAPYLAESWEMLGDTAVVFHLRDDVYWHDGVRTTAHDVAFTYRRAKDPETGAPNASYFARWGDVEVVDSFTVRFTFEPHAEPLAGWPFTPIVPRHLLAAVPASELRQAEFNQQPVGNGPFRFVSRRANDRWVFEANPDFPEGLGGRPYLDRLVLRVVLEQTAQLAELRTGNVDVVLSPTATEVAALDAQPDLRAIVRPSRRYLFVGWNGRREPFDEARVRRALSLAMDRQEILDVMRAGYGTLAIGPVGPWHWAYADTLEPLPYDPNAARSLLAEAGFRDRDDDGVVENAGGEDFAFELRIAAQQEYQAGVAQMIQSDLAQVGVRVSVRALEYTTLISQLMSPEKPFDAVLMGMIADFRLNLHDWWHSDALGGPFQLASYSNPEVDRIIDRTQLMVDREDAVPLLQRLQAILREEQPWSFLFYYPDLLVVRERLKGVETDIRSQLVSLQRWWIVAEDSD